MMRPTAKANILDEATSRDFSGGLNVADTELNLSSRYARQLDNLLVGIDQSVTVRQGTRLFADLSNVTLYAIRNVQYFLSYIIAVDEIGQVFAISGNSVATPIWNQVIAGKRGMWSAARNVLFCEFNGELIITNGTDKPLVVPVSLIVDYLADKGSGSNVNVPVALLIEKFSSHVVMAIGSLLYVSERNASGTWQGDVGAQFVNIFDMKPYVTGGSTDIVGFAPFKGYLLVRFKECIVPVQFTEDASATPKLALVAAPDSVLANYGAISHRTQQNIGDYALSCDIVGVASVGLSKFTRILEPDRPSRLIDPMLQTLINDLSADVLSTDAFSIYDRRLSSYMLFVPDRQQPVHQLGKVFCYRNIDSLKVDSWSRYVDWNIRAATRSSEGRIFMVRENSASIYVLGDVNNDPVYADYVGEQETFTDGTVFTDQYGLSPVGDVATSGVPIRSTWEVPWSDLKHRGLGKTLRYVLLDTEGDQPFTMKVFVDKHHDVLDGGELFRDSTSFTDDTGFIYDETPNTPALSLDFMAGDARAYGGQPYGTSPYGAGNITSSVDLTLMPVKFTLVKLRFEAETMGPLKYSAITLMYQKGTVRRPAHG